MPCSSKTQDQCLGSLSDVREVNVMTLHDKLKHRYCLGIAARRHQNHALSPSLLDPILRRQVSDAIVFLDGFRNAMESPLPLPLIMVHFRAKVSGLAGLLRQRG